MAGRGAGRPFEPGSGVIPVYHVKCGRCPKIKDTSRTHKD